jgi:hypothetical protein
MWTSTALASEHRPYRGKVWRLVEGQHRISTNRLASDSATQALLEELAEEVKPQVPEAARHLHFLLATPFRYGHRSASRFRRANERPGIFYAAEARSPPSLKPPTGRCASSAAHRVSCRRPRRWNTPASMCVSQRIGPWTSRNRPRRGGGLDGAG